MPRYLVERSFPEGLAIPLDEGGGQGLMAMRRAALLVLLALGAVVIPASPGWAQSSQPTAAPAAVEVRADFNHDGADDLAIGAPFERVGGLFAAGAAHVLYGSASGLTGTGSQVWTQDSPGVPRHRRERRHLWRCPGGRGLRP